MMVKPGVTEMSKIRRAQFPLASLVLLALALSGLAVACGGNSGDKTTGGQVRVVTSLELFADFIRHVGGDRVQVTALIPGNADPHTYEPVPSQVAKVTKADLVMINGLGLEKTLSGLIENNVHGGVSIIKMADGLPVLAGNPNEGETGNPHLWLNVQYAMRYVEKIRDALVEVDPEGTAIYQANAAAYLEELDALDKETAAAIESIPPERRKLVTFHDAFPYFAERYGLDIVGVVVESPGREPSARELANLTDKIRSQQVRTVFDEPEYNASMLEMAAKEAGVQMKTLLSHAYTDNVHSYVELIRFDVQQLVEGLG
jgi:manganese/iron transport system substrate-binding protein